LTYTTEVDCESNLCSAEFLSDRIQLDGARLVFSFEQGEAFFCKFEVNIEDHCGIGCTRIETYSYLEWEPDEGWQYGEPDFIYTNSVTGTAESIEVFPFTHMVISSCDAALFGFHIEMDVASTDEDTWSTIKSTY